MSEILRKQTAHHWAGVIADAIKQAEADGWVVGISDDANLNEDEEIVPKYILEVYQYDDLTDWAEVNW